MNLTWTIPEDRDEFAKIESIARYLKKAKTLSTYKYWKYNLYDFFEFIKIHPDEFVKLGSDKIEDLIEAWVDHLKVRVKDGELNPNSVEILVVPLKKFLIFNRVEGVSEAWIRIKANFPEKKRSTDEKYTEVELQKMYNVADYREKAMLGLLLSGMRIGATIGIKVGDIKPVEDWATVRVYHGTTSEYNTFLTPQGYRDILAYLDHRKRNGEIITEDSTILRNDFRPECAGEWVDEKGKKHYPEPLHATSSAAGIVIGIVRKGGVSTNSHNFKARHKTMTCHGFRKYFNTICKTSGMDSERVEMLLGHVTSLAGHYWRLPNDEAEMSPQDQKLFQTIKSEYKKCIPELTIGESELLRIKNESLEETVNIEMKRKDLEILELKRQLAEIRKNPLVGMSPKEMDNLIATVEDLKKFQVQMRHKLFPRMPFPPIKKKNQ